MNETSRRSLNTLIEILRRNRLLLLTLSAAVVFVISYLLILPALTLDQEEAAQQGGIDVVTEEQVAGTTEDNREENPVDADAKAGDREDTLAGGSGAEACRTRKWHKKLLHGRNVRISVVFLL